MSLESLKTSRGLYLTAAVVCLGHFFVDLMLGIWPVFKTTAQLDIAIAGLIAGGSAFIGEGLQMIFGSLSDRGYRKMMILSGIVLTLTSTFFAYTENYYLLFLFYLITCIGSGAFHPSGAGLMGLLTNERKGFFIAIFTASGALGMAVSQIVYIKAFTLFQGHSGVLAIFPLILITFALLRSFDAHDSKVTTETTKFHFGEYLKLFKGRDLAWLYVTQLCNASLFWGIVFLLPDVLKAREYEEWLAFGWGHMSFILGAAFLMVFGGHVADLYSPRTVILVATLVGGMTYYFFLLNPLLSDYSVLGVLFLMGASVGSVNPIVVSFGNRLVPKNPSVVSAFLMGLVWCVAECLGPGGGGFLTKFFEGDAPAKALGVLGIFFVIGFAAAIPLPKGVNEEVGDYVAEVDK